MLKSSSNKLYLYLILAMITWGFAWPSGKIISGLADSYAIIFWRFLLTVLSLIPIVYLTDNKFLLPSRNVCYEILLGGVLYTFYNQFFLLGLKMGSPGIGGVIVTTLNPILTYIIVGFWNRKLFTSRESLGIACGLVGGGILIHIWDFSWDSFFLSGNLFFVMCALFWAFLSMNSNKAGERISPILYGLYVNSFGALFDLILIFVLDKDLVSVFKLEIGFWIHLFYLAIVSTTFGTTIYFFASTRLGSKSASSFLFLVPLAAVFGSWLFLRDVPDWTTLIGGGFAVFAVLLLNSFK